MFRKGCKVVANLMGVKHLLTLIQLSSTEERYDKSCSQV